MIKSRMRNHTPSKRKKSEDILAKAQCFLSLRKECDCSSTGSTTHTDHTITGLIGHPISPHQLIFESNRTSYISVECVTCLSCR